MRLRELPLPRRREVLVRHQSRDLRLSLEPSDNHSEHPDRDSQKMLVAMGVYWPRLPSNIGVQGRTQPRSSCRTQHLTRMRIMCRPWSIQTDQRLLGHRHR